jgi:hypothetical protein
MQMNLAQKEVISRFTDLHIFASQSSGSHSHLPWVLHLALINHVESMVIVCPHGSAGL